MIEEVITDVPKILPTYYKPFALSTACPPFFHQSKNLKAAAGHKIGSGSTLAQHVSVVTNVSGSDSGGSGGLPVGHGSGGGASAGGGGGGGTGGAVSLTDSGDSVNFEFAPCPGRHFLTYGGRVLMVDRTRAEQAMLDMNTGQPFETVRLATVGRSRQVFEKLLLEVS